MGLMLRPITTPQTSFNPDVSAFTYCANSRCLSNSSPITQLPYELYYTALHLVGIKRSGICRYDSDSMFEKPPDDPIELLNVPTDDRYASHQNRINTRIFGESFCLAEARHFFGCIPVSDNIGDLPPLLFRIILAHTQIAFFIF